MTTPRQLESAASRLAELLRRRGLRVVFAESCTGGLVSAVLTGIPGISAHLCGSAVVYRVETKANWLGISRELLDDPGPVSRAAAGEMACAVLRQMPEAHFSAAVTGHLGPDAPHDQDGLIYIGVAGRAAESGEPAPLAVHEHWLEAESAQAWKRPRPVRRKRQRAAARLVLDLLCGELRRDGASP